MVAAHCTCLRRLSWFFPSSPPAPHALCLPQCNTPDACTAMYPLPGSTPMSQQKGVGPGGAKEAAFQERRNAIHPTHTSDAGQRAQAAWRDRSHPGQSILVCKLLAQGACKRGQPGAGPIGTDALIPDHLCCKVQCACRRRPVHNACDMACGTAECSGLTRSWAPSAGGLLHHCRECGRGGDHTGELQGDAGVWGAHLGPGREHPADCQ